MHQPLIRFLGRRVWPSALELARPHPAAPPEYRKTFPEPVLRDIWEAPAHIWRPKHHELQQFEIDAIQSGGASLH